MTTWQELFDRGARVDVDLEAIRETLAGRRGNGIDRDDGEKETGADQRSEGRNDRGADDA